MGLSARRWRGKREQASTSSAAFTIHKFAACGLALLGGHSHHLIRMAHQPLSGTRLSGGKIGEAAEGEGAAPS